MIRRTMRIKHKFIWIRPHLKKEYRFMVRTYWFLFIPVFIHEKILEAV